MVPPVEPSCGWQLEVRWLRCTDLGEAWAEVETKMGGWVPAVEDAVAE